MSSFSPASRLWFKFTPVVQMFPAPGSKQYDSLNFTTSSAFSTLLMLVLFLHCFQPPNVITYSENRNADSRPTIQDVRG